MTLSDGKRHSLPLRLSRSWSCVTVYHLVNVAPSAVAAAAADIAAAAAADDDGAAVVVASSSERQEMRTR